MRSTPLWSLAINISLFSFYLWVQTQVPASSLVSTAMGENHRPTNKAAQPNFQSCFFEIARVWPERFSSPDLWLLADIESAPGEKRQQRICENPGTIFAFCFFPCYFYFFLPWCSWETIYLLTDPFGELQSWQTGQTFGAEVHQRRYRVSDRSKGSLTIFGESSSTMTKGSGVMNEILTIAKK